MPQKLCCPQCGHEELQVVNESNVHTTGKNYSAGKGCLGYLLLGPLGLLCGSCGQGKKTQTTNTTYWVCPKCGKKFRNPEEHRNHARANKNASIVLGILFILLLIPMSISAIGLSIEEGSFSYTSVFGIFLVIVCFGVPFVISLRTWKYNEKQAKELEEAMAQRLREKSDEN